MIRPLRDLFNFYMDKGWLSIQIFFIRQARLMKREKRLFPIVDTAVEEMTALFFNFIIVVIIFCRMKFSFPRVSLIKK